MRSLFPFATVLFLVLTAVSTAGLAQRTPPAYEVIVHPSNPNSTLDRKFVEDAFLKKVTRWPNDDVIRPVDRGPKAPVRQSFSEEVLNRSVEAVKEYWQQRIFSGRDIPPPELDTDDDVVQYVLKYEGAVGYVSGTANLKGAKTVGIR